MSIGCHLTVVNPWFRVWITNDKRVALYPIKNRKLAKSLSLTRMIDLSGRKPKNENNSPILMFTIALYH